MMKKATSIIFMFLFIFIAAFAIGKPVAAKSYYRTATLSNVSSGIKITWSKDSSASGYVIYRKKNNGTFTKVKKIKKKSTVTYTDTDVIELQKYTYCIVEIRNGSTGAVSSNQAKSIYRVSTPKLKSVKSKKCGTATLSYTTTSPNMTFEVRYNTSSSMGGAKSLTFTPGKTSGTYTTPDNLKLFTKYYFWIRVKYNGSWSAWSSSKSAKITGAE